MEGIKQDVKEIKQALKMRNVSQLPKLPEGCPNLPCKHPEELAELENILQHEEVFTNIVSIL